MDQSFLKLSQQPGEKILFQNGTNDLT